MVPHEFVENQIMEIAGSEERNVAVAGVPDTVKGEKLVVVYSDIGLRPDEIVAQMRARSISNLWIPKSENFFKVEKIPILGSGKLDLAAVKAILQGKSSGRATACR